ncbi:paraneoplastic antigen Ma3 homolog [Littorina saxatilis]|uniref:paraneoplastic antigen Ma3 homolog n=1 Tax=Littorina saxatilis TaxID=31220 RepID=UPI0038B678F8
MADEAAEAVAALQREVAELKKQQTKLIILPSEQREVKKFYGQNFDKFQQDIARLLSERSLEEDEQYDFIIRHVSQDVRDEVACRNPDRTAEALLQTLQDAFGEKDNVSDLLEKFYLVKQVEGESITSFSHRLNSAFMKLQQKLKDEKQTAMAADVLRDRFVGVLTNNFLRKQLREEIERKKGVTFLALRDQAVRWAEEDSSSTSASSQKVSTNLELEAKVTKVLDLQQQVLSGLQKLTTRVDRLERNRRPDDREGGQRDPGQKLPFSKDGRPYCLECGVLGHIRRSCPQLNGGPPRRN